MSVPRLTQESVDELYANKNRKGVRELVAKFHTDHYQIFERFVINSKDTKFIKWFFTSGPNVYREVVHGILLFHNYKMLHQLNTHKINIKMFLPMMTDDLTATSIVKGTVPFEKLT